MGDNILITGFFATMPAASFFSDFIDEQGIIPIKLPSETHIVKYETEKYVKSINATFGVKTSFANRLGFYTLYSEHTKLEGLIKVILLLSKSNVEYKEIVDTLEKLKKTSELIKGGGNHKQILKFIMMLSVLLGNIYILNFMKNSFSYKYENSLAYKTMSALNSENCKATHNINPLIDYTFQSLSETNLLSENKLKVITSLFNTYKCLLNPENVKNMLNYEDEMSQSYTLQPQVIDSPNHQEYIALPAPFSTQLTVIPSFEKWNQDNSVQLFSDKILTKFRELQENSGLGIEQFIDSLINDGIEPSVDSKSTMKQGTTKMDVVNWVYSQVGEIIKTNIKELKEGRINLTFTNDIWPEIKHIAKMKRAYFMYKVNILEANTEKAIDEIYSLFIHATLMFMFTTTTILFQTKMLYKYAKAVLSGTEEPLQLTNGTTKNRTTKTSIVARASGGKTKKNKTKKNKTKKNCLF